MSTMRYLIGGLSAIGAGFAISSGMWPLALVMSYTALFFLAVAVKEYKP